MNSQEYFEEQLNVLRHENLNMRMELDRAKKMIARNSVLWMPEMFNITNKQPTFNITQSTFNAPSASGVQDKIDTSVRRIPLNVLLTECKLDYLNKNLHARIRFADHTVSYATSSFALQNFETVDIIARDMAECLKREIFR